MDWAQDRAGLGASSAFQRERKAGLHIQTHQKKEVLVLSQSKCRSELNNHRKSASTFTSSGFNRIRTR
eukprot:746687-Hanusia_phi.AAC.3